MSNSTQPSSRQNNWLSTLVLAFVAALGIPTAIIAVSTHFINEHPWLALIITLAFAVIVFIAYIVVRVWQKLESRWLDSMAESLDHRVQSMLSRYRKKYYQYLGFQHRDFDVRGLSLQGPYTLELNQVFIELSIDPTTIQEMSPNPISVPKALREGSHSIWDYLACIPLTNQHLVIIGPPGSGKTTLLKHITLTLLATKKQRRYQDRIPKKLPILLFLRDHVGRIHDPVSKEVSDFTLVDALHDHLNRWEQPEPPAEWVKRQLIHGRCLVMLDGLDEVADPQIRSEVVNWVQTQIAAYSQNRFIVTSRPFGFRSNPLSGVAVLEVRPFTSVQVEQFIHKWYLADEIMRKQKDDAGVRMRAKAEARELLQQLYNTPALLDLTVNPLLLTMIAIVHRYGGGGKLPEKRVTLYADICKVFLGKRQEARGQELELKPDQLQLVLQPLAYYMMQQGIRDISPAQAQPVIEESLIRVSSQITTEAFLKLVENVSGLLLERENSVYSFAHLTFQEYLTATHIRERQLGDELVPLVGHAWWQETIRLYCAIGDATPIINACLASGHPSVPALLLAFDCQKEARELIPEVKARLETILYQGMEDTDPERQHIAAEVVLARRLRQMDRLQENIFIDSSFITCSEYKLFLDEEQTHGKYYQPDHWKASRFSPSHGHSPVLGIRLSDAVAFCTWLTERETGPWFYRLPVGDELTEGGDNRICSGLPAGTGCWINDSVDMRFVWAKKPLLLSDKVIQEAFFRDRDRALVLFLAHDRAVYIARDFDLTLNTTHDLVRHLDLDLNLAQVHTLALSRAYAFARTLNLNLDHDLAFVSNPERDRDFDRHLAFALARPHDRAYDFLLARKEALALALIYLKYTSIQKGASRSWGRSLFYRRGNELSDSYIQSTVDSFLNIYLSLVVLEERIQGRLPACEGILIVKERKKDGFSISTSEIENAPLTR